MANQFMDDMPYTREADEVEWKTIEQLCPQEAANFLTTLASYLISEWAFATAYYPKEGVSGLAKNLAFFFEDTSDFTEDEVQEAAPEIIEAWEKLQKAFARATKVGDSCLNLRLGFSDAALEDGDHDACYTVDNAYQLSPAGEKFKKKLIHVYRISLHD